MADTKGWGRTTEHDVALARIRLSAGVGVPRADDQIVEAVAVHIPRGTDRAARMVVNVQVIYGEKERP